MTIMDGSILRMTTPAAVLHAAAAAPAPWYAAVVITGHERIVRQRLNEIAYREDCRLETFLPLVETQAEVPAKPATKRRPAIPAIPRICVPMFRGYLFVQIDLGDALIPWDAIREVRGYGRMLTNEQGRPVPVRGARFARMLREADKDGLVPGEAKAEGLRRFNEGEIVHVKIGPLAGRSAIFGRHTRETVTIYFEGKRATLPWEYLEAVA